MMFIETLKLINYRNYQKATFEFSPHINIILGENAQGKTNLIESIHVLSLTRSHRTNNDKDLIGWQQPFSKIQATVNKDSDNVQLTMILHPKGKKVSIGYSEQLKLSQYIGVLPIVLFAPEDLNLIKGAPQLRRRFIDMEIGQIKPLYLFHLSQYQKILKQRNKYLKESKIDSVYLDILTEQLIEHSAYILLERVQFINKLNTIANDINLSISKNKDTLHLNYMTRISFDSESTVEDIITNYQRIYQKEKNRELDQRTTLFGIHRDDLEFYINNRAAQSFASQGQQRTVILSLKLAEIYLVKEMTKHYPILLLDDVLSELDDYRQTYLLKTIDQSVQTFITTTNIDSIHQQLVDTPKIFHIKEGKVLADE